MNLVMFHNNQKRRRALSFLWSLPFWQMRDLRGDGKWKASGYSEQRVPHPVFTFQTVLPYLFSHHPQKSNRDQSLWSGILPQIRHLWDTENPRSLLSGVREWRQAGFWSHTHFGVLTYWALWEKENIWVNTAYETRLLLHRHALRIFLGTLRVIIALI